MQDPAAYQGTTRFARASGIVRLGWLLFLRDFRMRYRQTYFGYLWALVRVLAPGIPLVMVGSQFGMGGERPVSSYAVFALSGLVLWQIFWDSVTMPQWVTRRLRRLLSEARFSYQAILVAATSYVLFNGSLYLLLIVGTMLISRTPLPSTAVLGLLAIPGIILSGLAIGMLFVPFTFVYLDFRYGLPMVSPVLLWTAPIFYESPDSGFLHVLNTWNPLTYLVAIPRSWLTEGFVGNDIGFVLSLIVFGLIFVPAHRFYNRAIPIGVERVAHG